MFKKKILSVFLVSCIIYPLSLINQLLISYYFGTTFILDAYWNSFSIAMLSILYVQPVKEILLNEFYVLNLRKKNLSQIYLTNQLFLILIFTLFILSILWISSEYITYYLFPMGGINEYITKFLKHFCLYLFFLIAVELLCGILVTQNQPIFQVLPKLFIVLGSISIFIIFIYQINELVLIYGPTLGLFILFILCVYKLRKNFVLFSIHQLKFSFKFIKKIKGLLFLNFITVFYLFFEKYIMSFFSQGLVSAYQYGRSLNDIPQNLFVMALASSLWPLYLKEANNHNKSHFFEMTIKKIYLLLLILTLITILCLFYSEHIIFLVYYRGKFDLYSLQLTSECLKIIILSLIPMSVYTILLRAIYSLKEIKWVIISGSVGVFAGLFTLILSLILKNESLSLYHFPISQYVSMLLVSYVFLSKTQVNIDYFQKIRLFKFLIKYFTILFLIYLFFPNSDFEILPKPSILKIFIAESTFLVLIILILWFVSNIINVNMIKNLFQNN